MRATPAAALAAALAIAISIPAVGCSDVSGPAGVQTNSAPELSRAAAAPEVTVLPGQDIGALMSAHPAGTTYRIAAGVHRGWHVVPGGLAFTAA